MIRNYAFLQSFTVAVDIRPVIDLFFKSNCLARLKKVICHSNRIELSRLRVEEFSDGIGWRKTANKHGGHTNEARRTRVFAKTDY